MTSIVIIGSGIIGCAVAEAIKSSQNNVYVLEKSHSFGTGITSRNSGVIHAGMYYPPESLKARLCQEGRNLLYDWCSKNNIPHKKTGKLILALTQEDQIHLNHLYQNALNSGLNEQYLKRLSQQEISHLEPHIQALEALYSSESGIVDPLILCQSFYAKAQKEGAEFIFNCEVKKIDRHPHYTLYTTHGNLECDMVINAAGLYSDKIARMAGITKYTLYPWRGDYFRVKLPYPVKTLIYPPHRLQQSGLGIHLTIDTEGNTFLGPDSEPVSSKEDFKPKEEKRMAFYQSVRSWLTEISPNSLSYEACGIRPKLRAFDEKEEKDFVISEDLPGFFNLVGIESPGLTASMAIARYLITLINHHI